MSQTDGGTAEADDSTDSPGAPDEIPTLDADSPLEDLHTGVLKQLKQVEEDGEAVTEFIGHLLVVEGADIRVAGEVQERLVEFASTLLDEHDAVTVQEVALALWFELNRVEGMLSKDEDEPSPEDSQTPSPESAAGDGEGVLEASGEPEGDEAGESAPNIMFQ